MSLWDSLRDAVVDTGSRLGSVAGTAALKAKLNTDLLLMDRELLARKQKFGVELYDYVSPLSQNQAFYTSDDTLTLTLQPPLIQAQREIAMLEKKQDQQKALIQQAAQVRASAFRPAETWTDKLANAGKSAALGGNEAKLNTELALYRGQILHFKQEFGVNLYTTLEELEDNKEWLPTDREIRCIYDNCRRDIEKIQQRRAQKEAEFKTAMNGGVEEYDPSAASSTFTANTPGTMSIQTTGPQPSLYAKKATDQTPGQPSGMYPAAVPQQQQREPAVSMQPQQPAVRQQQPMPHQMQQSQAVLHSNLFAGMVPGAAAPPAHPFAGSSTQPQKDPFATSTQADPFAAFAMAPAPAPAPQQSFTSAPQHDPFADQFTPPPLMAGAQSQQPPPPQDSYVDPFSGL